MIFGKHLNKYYRKYGLALLLGALTLLVVDYVELTVPHFYQMVINGMNEGFVVEKGVRYVFDMDFLLEKIAKPMIFVIICMTVGRFLWRICIFGSAVKVSFDLRNEMFAHSKELSRQYYQVNKVGDLMSLYTNDLDTVHECFGAGFLMFFDALIQGGMSIGKMFTMNPIMALLTMIPSALLVAMSVVIGRSLKKKWHIRQEAYAALSDFSQESFSGIAVVKAFVKEGLELLAFKKLNRNNEKAAIDHTRGSVLLRVLVTLFVESIICIILGYGGYLVHEGVFNAGELMEFIGYFNAMVWPAMAISELIDMTSRGKGSLERISKLLDAPVDVTDRADVQEMGEVRGDIEFRNLTFRYPGSDLETLRNVSFTIHAGESVGFVGRTGAGKTTVVDLLLRTFNVPDGTIFLDGHDVNTVPIRQVREACAYVPQDNFLFSDTIARNIAFSDADAERSRVERAAVLSDVDENIRGFSEGYETVLGERGVTVSGGQKQRISIARALMKDAPVLIMDDSVSAVDTKTERTILKNLRETRAGKTTILIAHRISTIEQMDKVLFIDDGRIIAFDTHDKLCRTCPEYAKMVELQRLEEEGAKHNA